MSLSHYLNHLPESTLQAELAKCCAARKWGDAMAAMRPFASDSQVLGSAEKTWTSLSHADWLEAFEGHPKIGDVQSLRKKYANTNAWARSEQAGVASADDVVLQRLAELNQAYEAKFGYIFIVCATGKSAAQMLAILESRLPNDEATEINVAAGEQLKITLLRLSKLVS